MWRKSVFFNRKYMPANYLIYNNFQNVGCSFGCTLIFVSC